jgi:hypothetical protein
VQSAIAELRALGPQPGTLWLTIDPSSKSGWVSCNDDRRRYVRRQHARQRRRGCVG